MEGLPLLVEGRLRRRRTRAQRGPEEPAGDSEERGEAVAEGVRQHIVSEAEPPARCARVGAVVGTVQPYSRVHPRGVSRRAAQRGDRGVETLYKCVAAMERRAYLHTERRLHGAGAPTQKTSSCLPRPPLRRTAPCNALVNFSRVPDPSQHE